MNRYLPEAMRIPTTWYHPTAERMRRALEDGELLTATVLWCDEHHNLHVTLGGTAGIIPRLEAAQGIADGTVRDIAILTCVGKQAACKLTALPDSGEVVLSRAAAQQEAREHLFRDCRPGDILPAVVTNTAPFGVFCDVGCGVPALLGLENISVSRIRHGGDRFAPGQEIFVVLRELDRRTGRISLTHRELLGTWAENAERFRPGQTVPGIVRSIRDYGVFVELTPNLSGLAEPDGRLQPGDAVSVYIKSILPERRKIKLAVIDRLDSRCLPPQPLHYTQTKGHLDAWQYSPDTPQYRTVFSS